MRPEEIEQAELVNGIELFLNAAELRLTTLGCAVPVFLDCHDRDKLVSRAIKAIKGGAKSLAPLPKESFKRWQFYQAISDGYIVYCQSELSALRHAWGEHHDNEVLVIVELCQNILEIAWKKAIPKAKPLNLKRP